MYRSIVARRATAFGVLACLGCAPLACGSEREPDTPADVLEDDAITVASFNFAESELLGEIYGQALEARGYRVRNAPALGPREFVMPALAGGLVELVPEYAGTALEFFSRGDSQPSSDVLVTHEALARVLRGASLVALAPAPAQDANALVVTRQTAQRHGLERISDLQDVAPQLTLGGPPECPTRPFCLAGLERVYGLTFREFLPLDAGGQLTRQALEGGHVDVALLFTTDPVVGDDGLVVLADDRRLQPAENVTPVVHTKVARRWGPGLAMVVDPVSARLTTDGLRALNARVARGQSPERVARTWLDEQGLS